jgi:hypothetical protein
MNCLKNEWEMFQHDEFALRRQRIPPVETGILFVFVLDAHAMRNNIRAGTALERGWKCELESRSKHKTSMQTSLNFNMKVFRFSMSSLLNHDKKGTS